VDGTLVLSEWHDPTDQIYMADIQLSGIHRLTVEYYERDEDAEIRFWWKRTGDVPGPR